MMYLVGDVVTDVAEFTALGRPLQLYSYVEIAQWCTFFPHLHLVLYTGEELLARFEPKVTYRSI